jgi:UDP-N-acetylmuramate--alanine ligase
MPALNYSLFAHHPKRIHFIGISGIGMSALALLCLHRGWWVQGSALFQNDSTEQLLAQGARVFLYHDSSHISHDLECVVYSSAICDDHPELQTARSRHIPTIHRSDLLRAFASPLKTLAISGTHGKTTTTSLLGHILHTSQQDPLIVSGGMMVRWNSPLYPGTGPFSVIEADESDQSHMNFSALSGAILTNIEPEHMANYGNCMDNLWDSFRHFLNLATDFVSICRDAIDASNPWFQNLSCPITWYGTDPKSDFYAENIRTTPTGMMFDCHTPWGRLDGVALNLWGHHNVLNALGAISASLRIGLPSESIRQGLASFSGVYRRLTLVGTKNGIPIIDDYAHHPTEIAAVLHALHRRGYGRILALCQPHRYTRLRDTMAAFTRCFDHAHHVGILPVYAAGEHPIENCGSENLAENIENLGKKVTLMPDFLIAESHVNALMDTGQYDVVVCMGAGDITHLAKKLAD